MCYIKPRVSIPAKGKPVLYTCEGVENWTGTPKLLCPGQVLVFPEQPRGEGALRGSWVVLAVVWIGCLLRKVKGVVTYCCSAPSLRILMCDLKTFDSADKASQIETDLRYCSVFLIAFTQTNSHVPCNLFAG